MNDIMLNLSQYYLFGISLRDYALTLSIIIIGILIVNATGKIVSIRLKSRSRKRKRTDIENEILILVKKEMVPMLYALTVYAGVMQLSIQGRAEKIINIVMVLAAIFFSVKFMQSVVILLFNHYWESKPEGEGRKSIGVAVRSFIRIVFWTTAILIFLDNIGVKISGIIAGLGLGGIVIAFAAQALLTDFFSYFSIFLDRPFEIGDFIMIDTHIGTIDHIGIKTTRMRSISGEELIFSNSDMTGSRIHNFKRMERRRVAFTFGVTYDTKLKLMRKIPPMVGEIISSIESVELDRVHFTEFGDSSLNFEVVYHIAGSDFTIYRDIQQKINLDIMAAFEKNKIEFAFPSRTVYLKK
ncbi:MAG TPA: mechanosensitive ion channel family protein [Spirochaetota bacterium]|nr:mechanosensitive ion channel family protein [Spirochaetota bacterium]